MAFRLGFIGTGGIAQRHLQGAKAREDVEIIGHFDVARERAEQAAANYGGSVFASETDLYDNGHPDAVVICTPPFAHGDIEEEACKRGIPFFVEKPVAVDITTSLRVLRAVQDSGVKTQVGYMFRTSEALKQVRAMLAGRAVAMVQAHYYMPGLPGPAWWPKLELGGGQLIEQATHMLDLGRFLAGEVATVLGRVATVRDWSPPPGYTPEPGLLKYSDPFDIPDTTALILQYASGALGTLSCSLVPQAAWDVGFKVVADGLLVTIEGASARWVGDEEGSAEPGADWVNYVLYDFIDAVKEDRPTQVPYVEGVKSLAISVAGYESVRRGGLVELKDLLPADLT